ncbi:MAG: eCIS core domain-containing protein, partial [Almyronema sp.]
MIHSSKAQVTAKTQAQPTGAFMPVPPVQAKVSSTPAAMPAWEPTASEHQAAPPTSLASLFGHAPSPAASLPIQAKLTVGAVGDPYEQEADRVASQVVKAINSPADTSLQPQAERAIAEVQRQPIVTLQRTATTSILQRMGQAGGNVPEDVETKIQQAKGSGQTLDAGLQSKMGQAMGVDFSSVKVHTDTQSHQLNRAVQAKAFTTGSDVFFGQGQYNPGSQSGQELIAHELTHVVQQGQAVQRTLAPEKEAQLETVMQEDEKLQQKPDSAVQRTLAPDKEAQLEAMGEDEKLQQKPDSPIQRTPNDTIQRI